MPADLSKPPQRQPHQIDETLPETLPDAHTLILSLRRELADLHALASRHAELYEANLHLLRVEVAASSLPLQ
jgi:hypothetical protein